MRLRAAAAIFAANVSATAPKPPAFKALDANGDRSVDTSEFVKATEAGVKQKFAQLDKNGDGKLPNGEYGVVLGDEDCE